MDTPSPTPDPEAEEAARLLDAGLEAPAPELSSDLDVDAVRARFPELEILDLLGQGGMGVVWRVRQRSLDRVAALKVLPAALSQAPQFTERFTREARTLARLQHVHIVGVYEFGERQGHPFLLMEFVDGVTLRHLMDGGRLTPEQALGIVPQVCEALQHAHDAGVIHRDIKPENVLLDRQGRVKVADFGLAKLAERDPTDLTLTGTRQVMGTVHYMAPEQMKAAQGVDHRADIFSLGVVFYEMLTGELPVGRFQKPSEAQAVDARIDEIVLRALERERERRYQHASEVEADLSRVRESPAAPEDDKTPEPQPTSAADPAPAPARGWRGLNPWVRWAVILPFAGAILCIALFSVLQKLAAPEFKQVVPWNVTSLATVIVWGLCLVVSLAAMLGTHRHWGRFHNKRGHGLSLMTCLALLCVPAVMVAQGRALEDPDAVRGLRMSWQDATVEILPSNAEALARLSHREGPTHEIARDWIREEVQGRFEILMHAATSDRPYLERLTEVYNREGQARIRALGPDELEVALAEGTLGPLSLPESLLPIPLHALRLTHVRVIGMSTDLEAVFEGRGPAGTVRLTTRMAHAGGRWYFEAAPVRVETGVPAGR